MQVTKKYAGGGFFGNSQAKFGHMAGAEGGFDRKEFRDLRRRKRRGESLSGTEGQRLNYMKNVRGDRLKKGIAGAALLGAGAAVAGPAIAAKLAAKGGIKGLSGLAGKGGAKGLFSKARKAKQIADGIQDFRDNLTPEQGAQIESGNFYDDPSMNPYNDGGKIVKDKTSMDLLKALEAYDARKKRESVPSITGRSMDDKDIMRQLIKELSKKRRDVQSRPASIMG